MSPTFPVDHQNNFTGYRIHIRHDFRESMFERCVSSNEYPQWGFPIPSPILKLIPRTLRDEVPPHLSDCESADRSASPVLELVPGPHSSVAPVHRQPGDSRDRCGRIVSALVVQRNVRPPSLCSMPPELR